MIRLRFGFALLALLMVVAGCTRDTDPFTPTAPSPDAAGTADTVAGVDVPATDVATDPTPDTTVPDAQPEDGGGGDAAAPDVPLMDVTEDAGPADTDEPDTGDDTDEPVQPEVPNPFPWALESTDETCSNEQDEDGNGYGDCEDFGCSRNPAVTVCGNDSRWESSPSLCQNERDDDGDGLVDCDDPDCFKNPFHDVCPPLLSETACGEGEDTDEDGLVNCDDSDCLVLDPDCQFGGRVRVLFDQTADETSAFGPNSDWMADRWGRLMVPSDPSGEAEWHGALSSFAYDLYASGNYLVENLPSWDGELTYGDESNPQDLANYDVLILFEPSRQMQADEKEAVIRFVLSGGGLLAVSNHVGADRDGNGFSAPMVFNDLFDDNPVQADPFGFRFDEVDVDTGAPITRVETPDHPVIAGAHGQVGRIGFYQGCSARLTVEGGAPLLVISEDEGGLALAAGAVEPGEGRVVFVADSAIGSDATNSHGNNDSFKDSWHKTNQDNRAFFLNAIDWLAESVSR